MIVSYANDQKVIIQGSAIKPINLIVRLASAHKSLSPPLVNKLKFKCLYKLTVETELGSQLFASLTLSLEFRCYPLTTYSQ